ncbi:MAG: chorismate mutase [Gemmatimonadaceae bacterium]
MGLRAIRGATTVERDDAETVRAATRELLTEMIERNAVEIGDIVSVLFTVTPDLRSEFPAYAAREIGWHAVPLLCMNEIPVPGALARCIRALMYAESSRPRSEMRHPYLHGARVLRPDLLPD